MMVGLRVHGLDAFVGCSAASLVSEGEEKQSSYKTGHAKDALAEFGETNTSNGNFPLPPIRYTFTAESSRDDLMTKTYSCSRIISDM
jgi:hypothetical protein